ncbi:MAG TPA: ABC transporter ATP-binding protein [Candidatus Caldiarchaeum subterraneum]|uniref:ABC transporter ATP-binding protein n=1 Tax=Caldiarchaeum subterraneum TaxID=311458 RepID=A0A832ZX43_CALS0|nr:ABC transporter ATP-binding protein [Candidatus Caldarchaeum subterraneum]
MSDIRIENLVKRFDKTVAVDGVSLDINDGEFVVLLGPSGCGKTTTLRCIAGLETPDEGYIYIDGDVVNSLPPKDRDIAMVFQNYALYPHMTVYDNMAFPLKMRKLPKNEIDRRVREAARLLNIQHLLNRRPKQLSGGEQQRVALGRAIVRQPKAFLMDEPLSNLDAKLRVYMRAELKRLQKDLNITTVYVTHDQAEAMAMADRIAVMNRGKIQQYGVPIEIYNRPANTFVGGFIGSPPMNLIKASVIEKNGDVFLDAGYFLYNAGDVGSVLKEKIGGEVYIGVRPEDILLSTSSSGDSVFESEIYVVEPMGANMIIDLKLGGDIIKAVIPSTTGFYAGTRVWVGFRRDKIHIFDAKTGKLIV